MSQQTLYNRIGGQATVDKLIQQFYERVQQDQMLKSFFDKTDMEKLRRMQREFFGASLGGPLKYTGLELSHAHQGRGIQRKHFTRYVELLFETLKSLDLDQADTDAIIDRINLYADDVVGGGGIDG